MTCPLKRGNSKFDPDSLDRMRRVEIGGEPVFGCFQDGMDWDYFVVGLPSTRVGDILEMHLDSADLWDMEVEAYDFTPAYSDWGFGPLATFGDVADHEGDYRFGATDAYTWECGVNATYEATAYVGPNPDPYEPNDTIAQAKPWPSTTKMKPANQAASSCGTTL